MTDHPLWLARLAPRLICWATFAILLAALSGCIDAAQPVLTDGEPLLGERLHFEFYALRDGAAHDTSNEMFAWRNARYVPIGANARDVGAFTLHAFEGADLIVQSLKAGQPAEYAIARKLADGV